VSTLLLDTTDLGEAEAVLSATFARVRIAADGGGAQTRMRRTHVGSLAIDELQFCYDMSYDAEPPESILLCRVHTGVLQEQRPGQPTQAFTPNTVAAIGAVEGVPVTGTIHRTRFDIVTIDRRLLDQVAAGAPTRAEGGVRLLGAAPISPAANRVLVATIDYIRDQAAAHPRAANNQLIDGAIRRHLAAAVLCAYPNTAWSCSTIEDHHDGTPALLRKAMAFIDDNAHRDISLTDIAESIWVTPRAVQYLFRKHRDCTPTDYLRRVRLHNAHMDLVAGNPTDTTVAQIAAKCGFGHMGRFALHYRQAYGESPHETLRRWTRAPPACRSDSVGTSVLSSQFIDRAAG
jgi:AraC-like DNA-binding protein